MINRIDFIDTAKSLGMLLIIWGHIRFGWSHAFVYAFHIPLFFFLSGMVFDKKRYSDIKEFLKKKLKSLIIPYMIFSFLTWSIWIVYSYVTCAQVDSYFMPLFQTLIAQGSEGYLVHNVPLWFVSCLFVMELMYFFLANFKRIYITIITITLSIFSYCLLNFCKIIDFSAVPWSIDAAMLGIPFFGFGHWVVCKYGYKGIIDVVNNNRICSNVIIVFAIIFVYLFSQYNGSISFGHTNMGNNVIVAYMGAVIGIIMFITLCIKISESSFNNRNKLFEGIKWFGRNSLYAMVIHNPIKGFITVVISKIFDCSTLYVGRNFYYSLITFVITLMITVVGMIIINKFKIYIERL